MPFMPMRARQLRSLDLFALRDLVPRLFFMIWPLLLGAQQIVTGTASKIIFVVVAPIFVLQLLFVRRFALQIAYHWRLRYLVWIGSTLLLLAFVVFGILRAPEELLTLTAKLGAIGCIVVIFWASILAFTDEVSLSLRMGRLKALLLAVPIFMAVNIVLFLVVGVRPDQLSIEGVVSVPTPSEILSGIGLAMPRLMTLPSISGANNIATLSAASILCLIHLVIVSRRGRLLIVALIVPSLIALLLADSRGALINILLCMIFYFLCRRRVSLVIVRGVLILSFISSALLPLVYALFSSIGLDQLFIRQSSMGVRLGFGTGREFVWRAVWAELSELKLEHVVGYGMYGDSIAGIGAAYAWIFAGQGSSVSYHNTALQYVLDFGYLAAGLYFAVLWFSVGVISRSAKIDDRTSKFLTIFIVYIALAGISEAVGTVYHFELFLLLLGLIAFILSLFRQELVASYQTRMRASLRFQANSISSIRTNPGISH